MMVIWREYLHSSITHICHSSSQCYHHRLSLDTQIRLKIQWVFPSLTSLIPYNHNFISSDSLSLALIALLQLPLDILFIQAGEHLIDSRCDSFPTSAPNICFHSTSLRCFYLLAGYSHSARINSLSPNEGANICCIPSFSPFWSTRRTINLFLKILHLI